MLFASIKDVAPPSRVCAPVVASGFKRQANGNAQTAQTLYSVQHDTITLPEIRNGRI
jgi:hypothetical protein